MESQCQSKSVIIVSPSLNFLGGAQRACLHTISALRKTNCKLSLATVDKTDWRLVEEIFGSVSKPNEELYFFSRMPERLTGTFKKAFIAFFYAVQLFRLTMSNKYRLVINMGGEIVDNLGSIVYVNAIPLRLMHLFPSIQPKNESRWKSYSKLFSVFLKFLGNNVGVIVANSKFTQKVIEERLGKKTFVVNPPVESKLISSQINCRRQKNSVITISRFRSAKRLEIIPKIASYAKDGEFVVIGIADKESEQCLKELLREIERLGLKQRVCVYKNKAHEFTLSALSTAKIFLHTQTTEAFGMSIVESMAAGCIPIVPRTGGPWIDILDCQDGQYGFSYRSSAEAAAKIRMLFEDESLRIKVSERAIHRSMIYDSSVFENKFLKIVEAIFSNGKRVSR